MKYAYNIWISSALLLVVAACNREPVIPEDTLRPGQSMSIELTMDTQPLVTKSTFVAAESGVMEADVITKTSYSGDVTDGYERIDWTVNDVIRIFTDNESASGNYTWTGNSSTGKMTDYKVTGVTPSGNKSFATITPNGGQSSLKWGTGAHEVFALYPTPDGSTRSVNYNGHSGPLKFRGLILDGAVEFKAAQKSGTWNFTAAPPMTQAFLWGAASLASPVGKLEMPFRPLFNAIEVNFTRQDILQSANLPAGKAAADFRLNAVTLTSVGKHVKARYEVAFTKTSTWQQASGATTVNNNNGQTVRYDFPAYGTASGDLTASQNAAGNHVYASTGYTVRFFLPYNSYGASDGMKVSFEFKHSDNSTTFTRTLLLKRTGSEWLTMAPGDKLVLSPGEAPVWEYVLEAFPLETFGEFSATDQATRWSKYKVKSYRYNKNDPSQKEEVQWATYVNIGDHDGIAPEWVHIANYTPVNQPGSGWIHFQNTANGNGGWSTYEERNVSAEYYNPATVSANNAVQLYQDAMANNVHRSVALSNLSNLTDSNGAVDLSLYAINGRPLQANGDGTAKKEGRSTANCYVVSAPGWYKIPLVYGNMIKNGTTNSSAADSYHVDHRGTAITNPWIEAQLGSQSFTAELVWQDTAPNCSRCAHAHGVIDAQSLRIVKEGNENYLYFHLPQHSIMPGNNVIGVKVGNDLVWSWHIWVTPQTLQATGEQGDSRYLSAMIGWIPLTLQTDVSSQSIYLPRTEQLKVVQVLENGSKDPAGLEAETLFYQYGNASYILQSKREYKYGRSVSFQYGRKDPMFPAQVTGSNNKTQPIWNGEGNPIVSGSDGYMPNVNGQSMSVSQSIKMPGTFFTVGTPFTGNYWKSGTKSVYDPSPIGFRVIDDFVQFKATFKDDEKYVSIFQYGGSSWGFPGAYLKNGYLFLPASGYRDGQSSVLEGTDYGLSSAYLGLWAANRTYFMVDLPRSNQVGRVTSWGNAGSEQNAYPVLSIVE